MGKIRVWAAIKDETGNIVCAITDIEPGSLDIFGNEAWRPWAFEIVARHMDECRSRPSCIPGRPCEKHHETAMHWWDRWQPKPQGDNPA